MFRGITNPLAILLTLMKFSLACRMMRDNRSSLLGISLFQFESESSHSPQMASGPV